MRSEADKRPGPSLGGIELENRSLETNEGVQSAVAGFGQSDTVTVAICTFRRNSIFRAIESVANQRKADGLLARIIVIDNDEHDGLRAQIEAFSRETPVRLDYIHAPKKNISIARNAALDAVETRYLAFIDDDEWAEPEWLSKLMEQRGEVDVVVGVCRAAYDKTSPRWVSRCDFHSSEPSKDPSNAHTGNILMDMKVVRAAEARFAEELGLTGGEDTVFFRSLAHAGARFVAAPDAVVNEGVPASRANMRWVLRRKYRAGQTHGLACRMFNHSAYQNLLFTAGAKAFASSLMAVMSGPGTDRSRRWIARAAMHAGAMHYRLRPTIIQEYA